MKKITLISHFYNEEYLLPYWIRHHKNIFDHAILIDHKSTDRSRNIIKEMAPEWEIVDSDLNEFDPILTDFEVQKIEEKIDGWKIVLNTTEFIVGPVRAVIEENEKIGIKAIVPSAKIMVDAEPNCIPTNSKSLLEQKPFHVSDNYLYDLLFRGRTIKKLIKSILKFDWNHIGRSRLLHEHKIGGYTVGRHQWHHSQVRNTADLHICWYGFSPWNEDFIARKLGISSRLPKMELKLGIHHKLSKTQNNNIYKKHYYYYKIFGNKNLIK